MNLEAVALWRRRGVLLAAALVPLAMLRTTFDPINVPKLALLIVLVSLVATLRAIELTQGEHGHTLKVLAVPAIAIGAPLVLSWLFSPYRGWALFGHYPRFNGLLPTLVIILFGVLAADAFVGNPRPLAWASLASGSTAGAYALIQFVGLDPFGWTVKGHEADVVASTLGNPNFAGAFLAITIPAGIGLWLKDRERRILISVALVLILGGWVVTRSAGAWIAGVAAVTIMAGTLLSERWSWAKIVGIASAALLALAIVGVVVAAAFSPGSETYPATTERRAEWWHAAYSMAASAPILGRGPGAFAVEHSNHRTLEDVRSVGFDITDDPHNVPLSFLTSAGIIGALGFILAVGWAFLSALRSPSSDEQIDVVMCAAFLGSLTAYVVQALVSVDTIGLRVGFWTALAGVVSSVSVLPRTTPAARKKKQKGRQRRPLRAPVGVVAICVVGVAGVWGGFRFLAADAAFARAVELAEQGEIQQSQDEFASALTRRNEFFYRRTQGRSLGPIAVAAALAGHEELGRSLLGDVEEAFDYLDGFPHANAHVDYARVLRDWGSIDIETQTTDPNVGSFDPAAQQDALSAYQSAVELDPLNYILMQEAADLGLALEEYEVVVAMLEPTATAVDRGEVSARLALAYAHLGRDEEARELAERALGLLPEQTHALEALELLDTP